MNSVTSPSSMEGPIQAALGNEGQDTSDALVEALAINELLAWVEQARSTLEDIRLAITVNPTIGDGLREMDVRYNAAMWEVDTSNGLQHVLAMQRRMLRGVSENVRVH